MFDKDTILNANPNLSWNTVKDNSEHFRSFDYFFEANNEDPENELFKGFIIATYKDFHIEKIDNVYWSTWEKFLQTKDVDKFYFTLKNIYDNIEGKFHIKDINKLVENNY